MAPRKGKKEAKEEVQVSLGPQVLFFVIYVLDVPPVVFVVVSGYTSTGTFYAGL
jgi:hypothetical protein